jgi:tetratricopeptide (TPR) repeat protein
MYLRRKNFSMTRKRKPIPWFRLLMLAGLVIIFVYLDKVFIPVTTEKIRPTMTATRSAESYVTEAEALFNDGKMLQSIEMYRKAIESNPKDGSIYVAMARTQVWAGQFQEAQKNAENALLLNPNNSMAYAVLAWSLDFQKEYLQAETAIQRAIELDPNNPVAHAYYAEILVDVYVTGSGGLDTLDKAIEQSRLAQSLAPNALETHRVRGYILEITANYQESVGEYLAAVAINDKIPDLHMSLGRNYYILDLNEKAVEEFTRANALNPADPTPEMWISRTYGRLGDFPKASQFAEQSVNDSPTDPYLRGNWGLWLYKESKWPEAIDQLNLAINGGKSEDGKDIEGLSISQDFYVSSYYFTYALSLARTNRCGDALSVAQVVLARIPDNETAVYNANEAIRLCQVQLEITPTATPEIPTETVTPTPGQ